MTLSNSLCKCGCGGFTNLAARTHSRYGHVKGQPQDYIRFHGNKNKRNHTIIARLVKKVVIQENGCHVWTGACAGNGYGTMSIERKNKYVHRLMWELKVGPIPDGMCVCHKCDTPPCVNVEHLFLGTNKDNTQDMVAKGRSPKRNHLGTRNPKHKLTEEQVIQIRDFIDYKIPSKEVAAIYGVSRVTIESIRSGKTWSHLWP